MHKLTSYSLLMLLTLSFAASGLQINGERYQPVGKALFSVLWFDVYQSELYTPSGRFNNNQQEFVFKIDYFKDISNDDLIQRTLEQWQHINYPQEYYADYVSTLRAIWPNIKAGDQLMLVSSVNKSEFFYNGTLIGEVNDGQFGRRFLDIWVSPNTSQPKLRQQLLGASGQ